MALQKQNLPINFSQGLDQKTDPKQVQPGKFLSLKNSVFTKMGLLQKRNGFPFLASLPDTSYDFISTFNDNLTAIGINLAAYSAASSSWATKGDLVPIRLDTLPLIRTSSNQSFVDTAIAQNGFICTVYRNDSPSVTYNYAIADSVTGQNIVAPTVIATPTESPRVFVLGNYFIILFSQSTNLKYIAIPVNNPSSPIAAVTLVTNYQIGQTQLAFDGVIANNNLYVSYNSTVGGGDIRMTYLNSFLVRQTAATGASKGAGHTADIVSMCADLTGLTPVIYTAYYATAGTIGLIFAVDQSLNNVFTGQTAISAGICLNIALAAQNNLCTIFYEMQNAYSYGATLPTNFIQTIVFTSAGAPSAYTTIERSVGLASKAFIVDENIYVLSAYSSVYQPSYFLITDTGEIVSKLAYSNGGGYLTRGLPSVSIDGSVASLGYLIKDLLISTNKNQSPTSGTPVYTQTGINLASFDFTSDKMNTSEIGGNLNITGGQVWAYDGYQVVEQGFDVYPDNVIVTTSGAGGNITAQTYFYQAVYEWTDNQGNIHRSSPSLPVTIVTTGATSTNTIKVPTLRLTSKTLVKIVLYRWSTAQQVYYQVTSIASPTFNDKTVDNVTITDTLADSAIVGNSIIYTTGGVIENIGAPATDVLALYRSRLFLVDAEDKNLLWYSKQVIESTPVEMSDLFTIFVAPTTAAQGDTGPITSLSAMDDKLIIFKKNAIYYLVGNGPDNTGANNDFSEPVFITSTVGCDNQNSIVFIPSGLMFQSDKGIWLLGRDLNTTYIGKDVEDFNEIPVLSALTIPGTNQVRFTLDSNDTLMYDYFFGQWGEFVGIQGISSTLYQGLHTFIDAFGRVFKEGLGTYLDGANPVLMSFTTGWINLAGLQGYERAYFFYLLGKYITPHKLNVQIAYDYNDSPSQSTIIAPINYSPPYGGDPLYGSGSPYGGPGNVEQWRVFLQKQKCEAFRISVQEIYDPSFGVAAGAGLTLSGIDLIVGLKSSYPRLRAATSVG